MGLGIALQTEQGDTLEMISDFKNILHRLLPAYGSTSSILSAIDWYGDTIFNRLQMKQFLSEWENLISKTANAEEQSLLNEVERLALRCQKEVHLYLKFIGD